MSVSRSREMILQGSPDVDASRAAASTVQLMQLDMSNEILEQLLDCTRRGKSPKLQFGANPILRFNDTTVSLASRPIKIAHEVYKSNWSKNNELEYVGTVSHSLNFQTVQAAAAGVDKAIEQLQQSMSKYEQEKEAKKTIITPELLPIKKGKLIKSPQSFHLPQSASTHLRPTAGSASQKARMQRDQHSRQGTQADSLGETALSLEQAARYALIHLIAIESFTLPQIARKLRMQPEKVKTILDRLSDSNEDTSSYSLARKFYKELEPWEFPYSSESDREKAINNAIHAFDSMRIDPQDKLWQTLLPESKRGQGITLSKLKLQTASTPRVKPASFDRKTGLPKRAEQKKAEKPQKSSEASKPEKKKSEPAKSERESTSKPNKKALPTQRANPSSAHTSPQTKDKSSSSSSKSLLNKPKNPSPLAASPVNASDFEDNHPVHRALSASPTKGLNGSANSFKRKPAGTTSTTQRPGPKQAVNGNSTASSATKKKESTLATKPSEKRKAETDDQDGRPRKVSRDNRTPTTNRSVIRAPKIKQTSTPSSISASNKQSTTYSSAVYARSSTSDSASPDGHLTLSTRQRVELATKFKRYYAQYHKLYMKLSQSTQRPNQLEMDELMKKHNKLAEMKAQLKTGLVRE